MAIKTQDLNVALIVAFASQAGYALANEQTLPSCRAFMKARGTVAFSEMTDLAEDYIDANYQGNRQDTPLYSPCQIDNHLFAECQANPGLLLRLR